MAKSKTTSKPKRALSVVPAESGPAETQDSRCREAYQAVLPEANALRLQELARVNLNATTAVTTVLQVLPLILPYREQAKRLPRFDIGNFDRLEAYSLALVYALTMPGPSLTPPQALAALNQQCAALAGVLHADAVALSKRGLLDPAELKGFRPAARSKQLAFDTLKLTSTLRANWDKIAARTGLQLSELDHAESLAGQLLIALGDLEQMVANVEQQALQRQRSFTLFFRAYAEVRRALSYLVGDQDIDRIAPSLYARRTARARKASRRGASPTDSIAEAPTAG
jgi:hypothetical protein